MLIPVVAALALLAAPPAAAVAGPPPLSGRLLTLADLPAGYAVEVAPYGTRDAVLGSFCSPLDYTGPEIKPTTIVTVAFGRSGAEPLSILEQMGAPGGRAARMSVAETAATLRHCQSVSLDDGSGTMTDFAYSRLPLPRLGDASAGLRWVSRKKPGQGTTSPETAYYGKVVVIAQAGTIISIELMGDSDQTTPELVRLAKAALRKL